MTEWAPSSKDVGRMLPHSSGERPSSSPKAEKTFVSTAYRFESYLPQFFLGRALYQLGDLPGAVRAFDASEQSGAVKRTRYYQVLQISAAMPSVDW